MQFLIDIALTLVYLIGFLLLCAWSWRFWMLYINQKYLNGLAGEYVMLEIKLPREILKSPFATEVSISALLQGGGYGTWYDKFFKGNLPMYSSLEIASIEGVIHFYVRTQKKFRTLVESNFYAQYPGIEIIEADDYTKAIRYTHLSQKVDCWGAMYRLGETWTVKDETTGEPLKKGGKDYKMPADFYRIKTYVDYGLDKNPDDENAIDPMTPLLEMMGSMKKGEHMWFQIIVQDEGLYNDEKLPKLYYNEVTGKHWSLMDMIDSFKKQTRMNFVKKGTQVKDEYGYERERSVPTGEKDDEGRPKTKMEKMTYQEDKQVPKKEMELTAEEKWRIEEANNKIGKKLAVCVMRLMYVVDTTKAKFDPSQIQNVLSFPKPFEGANRFAPKKVVTPYNFDWENFRNHRVPWRKEEMFEAFVEREAFYPHIEPREWLDKMEDNFFWTSTIKARKTWRMFFEAFFHPFHHPHPENVFTLNLEEIASLWHLPGAYATTPSLPRIDSAKGVAPVNLPQ